MAFERQSRQGKSKKENLKTLQRKQQLQATREEDKEQETTRRIPPKSKQKTKRTKGCQQYPASSQQQAAGSRQQAASSKQLAASS